MSFPPESPQDYCDYFQGLVSYGKPPNPKWESGLKASQLWRDYGEQDDQSEDNQLLISSIQILMSVRSRGSVLLDLWERILRQVIKLPVAEQKPIWLEIFNVVNQGEDPIKYNEVAIQILLEWAELDHNAAVAEINKKTMINMADKMHRYTFSGYEWIAFTVAINEWFKRYIDEPSFYNLVRDKFGTKRDGLEAA